MPRPIILVAGATGTNGREVIKALGPHHVTVRAFVTNKEQARKILGDRIEIVEGDLRQPATLAPAFEGVDKAYVLSGVLPNTIEMFGNFFDAAKAAGVSHIIKFSGLGASLDSASAVIRQHGASDDLLREIGLTHTILRPNSFHQNMLQQAASIAKNNVFYLPMADARQSTIDVRDIAEITAKVLTENGHEQRAYDLTGPESLDFHEVATILGDVRGKPVSYVPISVEATEAAMKEQGVPDWTAHAVAEIQGVFATGAYADVLPDAERLLGRRPRSFREFAEDHVTAFQSAA